ncbi:MAG: hypothetical protein NZ571_15990, partial [Anaerolineae bacterium]|nr:hypothetical protein [Anaerolineae bacterium]
VVANLFAVLLSLPLLTAPLAFAGLAYMAHAAHSAPTAHPDDFWRGVRRYLWHGLLLGALNIAFWTVLYVNFAVYAQQTSALFWLLRGIWLAAASVWLLMLLYVFPLLEEMERQHLGMALYNAALMVMKNPFFSAAVWLCTLLIVVGSALTVVPLLLFTLSLLASISSAAVIDRLAHFRRSV